MDSRRTPYKLLWPLSAQMPHRQCPCATLLAPALPSLSQLHGTALPEPQPTLLQEGNCPRGVSPVTTELISHASFVLGISVLCCLLLILSLKPIISYFCPVLYGGRTSDGQRTWIVEAPGFFLTEVSLQFLESLIYSLSHKFIYTQRKGRLCMSRIGRIKRPITSIPLCHRHG